MPVNLVHDDVRAFDQLARTRLAAPSAHLRQTRKCKATDPIADAPDHVGGGVRIVLFNPRKDAVEVVFDPRPNDDLHTPKRRRRSVNSSKLSVSGSASDRRRRTSASCSSVSW